jgi:eukaryotic-like serine/threonine-protein kinase
MGAVYLARDNRFKVVKHVAIKEIIAQVRDDTIRDTLVKTFEREANLLATVNHSAIPKIHDYFTIGKRSYLVMQFIEGNDLENIIERTEGLMSIKKIVIWGIEICDVLHYLHTRDPEPIVFRDIKPSNIMITPDNHVVLVDFGIAKEFEAGQKGTMIGTEGYSPPEQYRGEASPQVDIYALGATLHHLLSGIDPRDEAPFTFTERPIKQVNPEVPVELENIIDTALQYNANERFQDANIMKDALILIVRKSGTAYAPPGTVAIPQDYEIKPLWTFECEDEIRGTPLYENGFIYVGAYDNNVYAIDATTGEFTWKYACDGGVVSTPAHLAGNIFFGSEDQRVHAVSSTTGRVMWTYFTEGPIRSSPIAQDRHVFIGSDDEHLHIVNATTGQRANKIHASAPIRSSPLIHNDAIFFGTETGDFFCSDFSGKVHWRINAKRAVTSSPRIQDNVVYFSSIDGMLYAIDAKTGWTLWRFRMDRGSVSTPYITERFAYIGSADGHIYCVNLQSAKEVWHFKTEHQVSSSPIIYKDALYCGSVDGNLYCLDAKSGHLRWNYATHNAITGSPIIHDDIVYIGSTDHKLYALPA